MSFTRKVLLGLCIGIFCGAFFGEKAALLQMPAMGFIKLLQMTVLPYVVLSIVSSLGSLDYHDARRLGMRVGIVILGLWAIAIGFAFLMPLTFPPIENASFFSASMLERRPPFNLVDLYIPSNPFHALANNIVPATVLFSVLLGIALIGVPAKRKLLDVVTVGTEAVSRATRFVTRLTPYGIFAIAAHAAGTLSLEQLGQIEIYLAAYIAVAMLLAFWVLPGLVHALTGIPLRDVLGPNRDALIMAFVAGDLFIVLPSLMESCEKILIRNKVGQHDEHKLPEVIVPASFNFPHAGKLLSLSFILFAGWFADASVSAWDYPQLAVAGILSIFGSLNAAVPFLLDLFRIPADTFQLYLATGVLNARFGALVAAMHVIAAALLGAAAIAGTLRIRTTRMARYGVVTLLLTGGLIAGMRMIFAGAMAPRFEGRAIINRMQPLFAGTEAAVLEGEAAQLPPKNETGGVYESIRGRGVLRVGYFANRIPFVFINGEGKLVGYEVESAQLLASEIGVRPQFIPIEAERFAAVMESGHCDIIMSAVALTPRRQAETLFSDSYLDETLSFVVPDHRRNEFESLEAIRRISPLRIAVPNIWHYVELVGSLLPSAEVVPLAIDQVKPDIRANFDAYVLPAENGAALTLMEPKFTVVIPAPNPIKIPVAYPVARRDQRWASFVNAWIEVRRKDGTLDRLYRHWVLGESAKARIPRWSIIRDVLHWGK